MKDYVGSFNFISHIRVIVDAVHLSEQEKKPNEEIEVHVEIDEECCGAHEVCDRDSLPELRF